MQPYTGTNPPSAPPTPSPYGIWPTPNVVTGGNPRSAQNLMTAVESVTDRTNWLKWRILDTISGGTYTFLALLTTANHWIYNGIVQLRNVLNYIASTVGGGAFLYVGDSVLGLGTIVVTAFGTLEVRTGGTLYLRKASTTTVQGPIAFVAPGGNSDASLLTQAGVPVELQGPNQIGITGHTNTLGGSTTIDDIVAAKQGGLYRRRGSNAAVAERFHDVTDADENKSFDPSIYDIITTPAPLTGGFAWTLEKPPVDPDDGTVRICARFRLLPRVQNASHTITIKDWNGTVLGSLHMTNSGILGHADFYYNPDENGWRNGGFSGDIYEPAT